MVLLCSSTVIFIKLLLLKSLLELVKNYKRMGVFNTRVVNDWLTERLMLLCWFYALKAVDISRFLGEIYRFSSQCRYILNIYVYVKTCERVNANCQFGGSCIHCFSNPLCYYTWSWNSSASAFSPQLWQRGLLVLWCPARVASTLHPHWLQVHRNCIQEHFFKWTQSRMVNRVQAWLLCVNTQ